MAGKLDIMPAPTPEMIFTGDLNFFMIYWFKNKEKYWRH